MTRRISCWFLLMALLGGCDTVARWTAIRENREGVVALKSEQPARALENFAGGLSAFPFEPALHMNLGLSLDVLKRPEESLNAYRNAEQFARTDDERFFARFNLAEALGRAKKLDEALAAYQRALEIRPDSKVVKTNIELLNQQGGQNGQQNQQGEGQGQDKRDQQKKDGEGDQKKDQDKDKDGKGEGQDDQKKSVEKSKKYQPRPFKGDLSEGDVKKILGEIRQQEQRIRAEFNRREGKERPRDKDW